MGASASKKDDATSKQGASTRGPINFDQDTLRFLEGGPPPPPTETSTRLQPQWNEAFMRLTEKARTKQASRAMSTREALDAYKNKYGEPAAVKVFGDEAKYFKSIVAPVTVSGTSSELWWLKRREYEIRSKHGQEIQATDAQRTGAAILAAPGDATGAGGDTRLPWADLPLVASSSARRDEKLNHWEGWFKKDETPFQVLWDDGNWPADEEPPEWNDFGAPHGAPPAVRQSVDVRFYYRGLLPDGVNMSKTACRGNPTMEAHWARAEHYSQVRARYDAELAAYRAMCAKWRAQGNGRPSRGGQERSHDPKDAYADLTRAKTEKLIKEDPRKWHERHHSSLTGQLARKDELLEAIAKDAGVPRCVLTALDKNEQVYLLSPAIKVNFPGLGSQLVLSNYDHIDMGWEDDHRAIRKLGFRRLTWDKLNKKLPGYEHLIKDENAAERLYLDAYLNNSLCFDSSFGKQFVFEIEIDDESKFWGMKTHDQQTWEMYHIRNHHLKGAILGATEGSADAAWNSST